MGQVSEMTPGISRLPLFSTVVLLFWGRRVLEAREHVLGVTNSQSSLGKIWASCHHSFVLWGHVSCFCLYCFVAKQTCFLELSLTYKGLPYFSIYNPLWGLTT